MSIGPIANLAGGYLQSIISPALRNAGLTTSALSSSSAPGASQPDNGQLSPFAQLLNTLQQLQQSNPAQYGQVTQQIATNLQSAAQTAQSSGNTAAASTLNSLAGDFTAASQSGQLPDVRDLAKAVSGGHGHHHHAHAAFADPDSATNSSGSGGTFTNSVNSPSQMLSQLLASFQTNTTQNASTDPASIILNTLSSAGVGGVNA